VNYTKPQIVSLGEAKILIGQISPVKPPHCQFDGPNHCLPAYDLDE